MKPASSQDWSILLRSRVFSLMKFFSIEFLPDPILFFYEDLKYCCWVDGETILEFSFQEKVFLNFWSKKNPSFCIEIIYIFFFFISKKENLESAMRMTREKKVWFCYCLLAPKDKEIYLRLICMILNLRIPGKVFCHVV